MRSITITYKYSGPEEQWRSVVGDFIAAIDRDEEIAGRFSYQVAVADDKETRIHWGRWDSQQTLKTMQSRDYFKAFAAGVNELAGGQPSTNATNVVLKTGDW